MMASVNNGKSIAHSASAQAGSQPLPVPVPLATLSNGTNVGDDNDDNVDDEDSMAVAELDQLFGSISQQQQQQQHHLKKVERSVDQKLSESFASQSASTGWYYWDASGSASVGPLSWATIKELYSANIIQQSTPVCTNSQTQSKSQLHTKSETSAQVSSAASGRSASSASAPVAAGAAAAGAGGEWQWQPLSSLPLASDLSVSVSVVSKVSDGVWYYLDRDRHRFGPYSVKQCRLLYRHYIISDATLMWSSTQTANGWRRLSEFDELQTAVRVSDSESTIKPAETAPQTTKRTRTDSDSESESVAAAEQSDDDDAVGGAESSESLRAREIRRAKKKAYQRRKKQKLRSAAALQKPADDCSLAAISLTNAPPEEVLPRAELIKVVEKRCGLIAEDEITLDKYINYLPCPPSLSTATSSMNQTKGLLCVIFFARPESVQLAQHFLNGHAIHTNPKKDVDTAGVYVLTAQECDLELKRASWRHIRERNAVSAPLERLKKVQRQLWQAKMSWADWDDTTTQAAHNSYDNDSDDGDEGSSGSNNQHKQQRQRQQQADNALRDSSHNQRNVSNNATHLPGLRQVIIKYVQHAHTPAQTPPTAQPIGMSLSLSQPQAEAEADTHSDAAGAGADADADADADAGVGVVVGTSASGSGPPSVRQELLRRLHSFGVVSSFEILCGDWDVGIGVGDGGVGVGVECVALVKFVSPLIAAECIRHLNGSTGRVRGGMFSAEFYDGKSVYGTRESVEEEESRMREFGDWLEAKSHVDNAQ